MNEFPFHPTLANNFLAIDSALYSILQDLRDQSILITGGTGFFGKWLLSYLCHANQTHQLNLTLFVLSRNPTKFLEENPEFRQSTLESVRWITGDVRSFNFDLPVDYVIHAATEASEKLNKEDPAEMLSVTIEGTRNLLKQCASSRKCRILLTSSGAVYGTQNSETVHQPDDSMNGPDTTQPYSAYAEGKRVSELLASIHSYQTDHEVILARCFAFVGPYLPLNAHFAVGNFISNCLNGEKILIKGDGTPHRSYLYAADLVIWLITLLVRGRTRTSYNVGSEETMSIAELAHSVAKIWKDLSGLVVPVEVLGRALPNAPVARYVPATTRAREALSLVQKFSFEESMRDTFNFYREQ
jgi:nucleoside-diphosphate-sugar epimerase